MTKRKMPAVLLAGLMLLSLASCGKTATEDIRSSAPSEEKYLSAWAEMGFPAETVAEAFDRTILHCHEFRWPYCNGILKRWHEKGLHTLAEVRAENAKEQSKPKKNTTGGNAWMKEYLNQ